MRARFLAVLAVAVSGLGLAPGLAAAAESTLTFDREYIQFYFLDRYVPGRSAGDQTLFTAELRHPGSEVRGLERGFCMTVSDAGQPDAGPFVAQCRTTLQLPE